MAILSPPPASTRQFAYDAATSTFSADMSDTAGFGRVYDDACDEGLTLVSSRTGATRVFVVTDEHRDADNDVTHWTLTSLDGAYRMVVWND